MIEQLFAAVAAGNEAEVRNLINAGADITKKNIEAERPLHIAAKNGHNNIVTALIVNLQTQHFVGKKDEFRKALNLWDDANHTPR